jgi:hypothetical protein
MGSKDRYVIVKRGVGLYGIRDNNTSIVTRMHSSLDVIREWCKKMNSPPGGGKPRRKNG